MIVRAADRLGTIYLDTKDFMLVREMPLTNKGPWTFIGLTHGREVEVNSPISDVLEWWGWEGAA